jgi:hypothetical protein
MHGNRFLVIPVATETGVAKLVRARVRASGVSDAEDDRDGSSYTNVFDSPKCVYNPDGPLGARIRGESRRPRWSASVLPRLLSDVTSGYTLREAGPCCRAAYVMRSLITARNGCSGSAPLSHSMEAEVLEEGFADSDSK